MKSASASNSPGALTSLLARSAKQWTSPQPQGVRSIDWSGLPCETRFWDLEIGTSQSILPVGAGRFGRTPHIALSGAFLALRASDCNGRSEERRVGKECR